jgi:predicted nucleotidyltransferase
VSATAPFETLIFFLRLLGSYSAGFQIIVKFELIDYFCLVRNNLNKDFILQTLAVNKLELAGFGVSQIGLFGSYVRNEANENSDIDLLVDIRKDKKTFNNFLSLNYYLEDLFGKRVELVTTQSLSPFIGPHILKTVEYAAIAG